MTLSKLIGLDALTYFIAVWLAAHARVKADRADAADKKERALIAMLFNNRYTYKKVYTEGLGYFSGYFVQQGNAWMCPECNTIHLATEMNGMTGVQYPSCCSSHTGHRLYNGIELQ